MSNDVKMCPECRDEYTLQAIECADCHVPLIFPDDFENDPAPENFPPSSDLECVRVGPIAWTRALSSALEQATIPHRVEPDQRSEADGGVSPNEFDGADVFGTWVQEKDLAASVEIDKVVFAHVHGQEADAPSATEDEVCPACQSPIAVDDLECSDCGLHFG
ncbi:MAG: hypothetical protein ABGW98_17915 [Myxococcales bacterium]|jgi:hypothetical protein|nr:hypothetical protein [Myxococcales bacterium]